MENEKSNNTCGADLALQRLFPPHADASTLKVSVEAGQYSASAIARAVEDCDAHLLNLNITADTPPRPGEIVVELRVSHRNTTAVAHSLARYGMEVIDFDTSGADLPDDVDAVRRRVNELLHIIDL